MQTAWTILKALTFFATLGFLVADLVICRRAKRMLDQVCATRRALRKDAAIGEQLAELAGIAEDHNIALQGLQGALDHIVGHVCNHQTHVTVRRAPSQTN